ncbi:MAG: bifunctional 4-hydroxy-3-methylbut-2-enyl diphosphate reductase/30S ribosomal protein S1 [Oscillospiraceae bacterium]|nr:bifunctional 4-hydroxy-3-methylbut-2-enyl diphosphate reductase/30S ribosomal protein S1 [Oscillospiraceae bacterium]
MKVLVAKTAGFCYGVSRAVTMCEKAAEEHKNCVTLGPIIHNSHVTCELGKKGVKAVSDLSQITKDDTVIIRSHGAGKNEYEKLHETGALIIDATCPDVKKIHEIVETQAQLGRFVLIIGQRNHPEISAISEWCTNYEIIEALNELKNWLNTGENAKKQVSVVFQTTSTKELYDEITKLLKKECTNLKIFDTICDATYRRQSEASDISKIADTVIVIGDESSANSKNLASICKEHCKNVLFIQSAADINISALDKTDTLGITAGASTPAFIIKEVLSKMGKEEIMDGTAVESENEVAQAVETAVEEKVEEKVDALPQVEDLSADEEDEDESFEAMLEKSIKTLRTGEKVSGIVTSITSTEVSLDLGTKQSGYIPISEFTDDENTDINEIIKIGDTIESFVMRVNDVEGMVMLSKRRLDAVKNWDIVEAARESRAIVEGTVIQENRGGVVVNVKGVHVFVPASQTGLPKTAQLSEILKKNVKLRINEVNQSRRRVVGSIRDVQKDERREKSEKVWTDIEVGKKYAGIVKSMTSYGVFVDIGGVDGMIHISELSWTRIKQPSEIMAVGDEVSVYVISFDKDSRKISLGFKKGEDNPWTKFTSEYAVGDVINVKVVKMMPFGAFAEICTGVDGLIHISQIADHRIGLPSEVLTDGQMVDVKITEIDNDRKKVSLSIKALIEPSEQADEDDLEDEAN